MSLMLKRACVFLTLILASFLLVCLINTITITTKQIHITATPTDLPPRTHEAHARLAEAIRWRTVSEASGVVNSTAMLALHKLIKESFPLVHASTPITLEIVNQYSLLYTWPGSDPGLKPYMLASHLDVVPVPDETVWSVPPFDGTIKDGYIWGRGTMDDKQGVFAILEAVEFLLSKRFEPRRTLYLAFGHDEEVSGVHGAGEISKVLKGRGVQLEYMMDEGLMIADGLVPGLNTPVAMIGTAEKGYMDVEMSVTTEGGHASMPSGDHAISILAKAITRLETNPQPGQFGTGGPESEIFSHLLAELALPLRVVMSNMKIFAPLLNIVMGWKPTTNALIRTTTAVTVVNGGVKSNVISSKATAIINHRIHPANTPEQVLEWDKAVVADDRVKFKPLVTVPASPVSPCDNAQGYDAIQKSVREIFPKALVAPGLFIAASDTRHYWDLTPNIYRFNPIWLTQADLGRFHGIDERIGTENYSDMIALFVQVIRNTEQFLPFSPPTKEAEL